MDQEILVPKQQPNFLTRKNILFFFTAVIVLELIWAGWTFIKPTQTSQNRIAQSKTTISLVSPITSLKVGAKTTVSINISSVKKVDGVDLIINYDPKVLTVEANNNQPVAVGTIFSDYPQNTQDPALGRITVSGISSATGGVLANGLFGSIVFRAVAPGTSQISIDYAPGSTTKSNVAQGGKNILDGVTNLQLNVSP